LRSNSCTILRPFGVLVSICAVTFIALNFLKDLTNIQSFLNSVMKKLSNERFVSSAPEAVVALEKAKQADAEAKIKVLEERIGGLR